MSTLSLVLPMVGPILVGLTYVVLRRKKYPPLFRPQYRDFHFKATFKVPAIRGFDVVMVPTAPPLAVKTHITMMPSTFEDIVEGVERGHRDDVHFAWVPSLDEQLRAAVLEGCDQYTQFTERSAGVAA